MCTSKCLGFCYIPPGDWSSIVCLMRIMMFLNKGPAVKSFGIWRGGGYTWMDEVLVALHKKDIISAG